MPADPVAAATYLAQAAHDQTTSPAAVVEILTRSGIPIVSSTNGRLLNVPAVPTLVDAYVYDFEVGIIADDVLANRVWTVTDFAGFASVVGLQANGQPLPGDLLAKAISGWEDAGAASPGEAGAFPALAARALAVARASAQAPAPLPASGSPTPEPSSQHSPGAVAPAGDLDPLQFTLAAANLLSHTGRLETTAARGPATLLADLGGAPLTGTDCQAERATLDSDPTGLAKKAFKDSVKEMVGDNLGQAAKDQLKDFLNGADAIGDAESVALLLAGLEVDVKDDANYQGEHSRAHYAHSVQPATYHYVGFVKFQAPYGFDNADIDCLALAGVKLPHNGPLKGWLVQWKIEQDGDHVQPFGESEARKLGRTGGAGGQITDDNGLSTLEVEVRRELGCPNDPSCGNQRNPVRFGQAIGIAQLASNPDSPLPLKISDLLGLKGLTAANVAKPVYKLLLDLIKNMALPSARDPVEISWHEPRFELVFESTVRIHVGGGVPDGGGHVKATVPLEDDGPGTFATGKHPEEGMSLSGHAPLEFIKVFGNDNACTPGVPTLAPGDFTVVSAKPVWGTAQSFPVTPDFADLELHWSVHPEWYCPNGEFFEPTWKSTFDRTGGHLNGSGEYIDTGFSANGLTLTKHISVSKYAGLYTEDTTIILRPIP